MNELDDLLQLAEDASEEEEWEKEIDYLKKALKIATAKRDIAFINQKIGTALNRLEKFEEAKEYLFSALEKLNSLSEDEDKQSIGVVNYELGYIQFCYGNHEKAVKYYLETLKYVNYLSSDEKFIVFTGIGVSYEKLEQYNNAIEFYRKAKEVPSISEEDKSMILHFLGGVHDKRGDTRKAFEYYHEFFSINPKYDDNWYEIYRYGELAYKLRRYTIALKCFKNLMNLIPPNEKKWLQSALQSLGNSYIGVGEHKQAISELKKALKIKPISASMKACIFGSMAHAYFGLDKPGKVIKFCLKTLNEEAEDVIMEERMYFYLAFCYGMWGIHSNTKKEEYYTEKLRSKFPESPYLRDLMRFF